MPRPVTNNTDNILYFLFLLRVTAIINIPIAPAAKILPTPVCTPVLGKVLNLVVSIGLYTK